MNVPPPTPADCGLRHGWFWWAVGAAQLAAMLYLALIPIPAIATGPAFSDKVIHFLAFMYLCIWFCGLVPRSRHLWIVLLLVAYGVGMEWLQGFSPVRRAEPADLLADVLGLGAGWLLARTRLRDWPRLLESVAGLAGRGS